MQLRQPLYDNLSASILEKKHQNINEKNESVLTIKQIYYII